MAIDGAALPALMVLGEAKSAMAKTFPPDGESEIKTLDTVPQFPVGAGKPITDEFVFVPFDAEANADRLLETATRAYPPEDGSPNVPALFEVFWESPK